MSFVIEITRAALSGQWKFAAKVATTAPPQTKYFALFNKGWSSWDF